MSAMKVGPGCNIKTWSIQFNTFQDFLPRCLWVAGSKQGLWPEGYGEERRREILEFALSKEHQTKLISEGWCLSENSYDQSIGKVKEIKPKILLKLKEKEEKKDNAKAILELQQKAGLRTKSGSRSDKGKGKYGNKDNNRSTSKENRPKDGNGYYLCGNWGKTHKGLCCKPIKETTTDQNTTPRKDWVSKKATRNYIKQMVTSESKKKIRKGKGKRRYSSDSSSSEESSSDGELRRSSMSGVEQMHMPASAGINPNDSDIEFEPEDERRYKKQAKKWTKSKGKRRRR